MEGLRYIRSLEQWTGKGTFDRTGLIRVLDYLGNPQDKVPAVHVAGTNGKGSVSTAIASILGASGKRVGLYTSPHLVRDNERIVIDGRPVSDEILNEFGRAIMRAGERRHEKLSFFEAMTAVAFLAFLEMQLDYGVYEVGLGGRLDATNTIRSPELGVIVTIGYDHVEILGDTLAKIAIEKAGIIKSGMRLVVGDLPSEAIGEVLKLAGLNQAKATIYGRDFEVVSGKAEALGRQSFSLVHAGMRWDDIETPLLGAHQLHNMSIAAVGSKLLGCSEAEVKAGIGGSFWPGRIEVVNFGSSRLILDAAHNLEGMNTLINFIKANDFHKLTICFGVVNTKPWKTMIDSLRPFVSDWNLLAPEFAKALPLQEISEYLSGIGIKSNSYQLDYDGLLDEFENRADGRTFLMTGSIYMIGRLRGILLDRGYLSERPLWSRKIAETNARA